MDKEYAVFSYNQICNHYNRETGTLSIEEQMQKV